MRRLIVLFLLLAAAFGYSFSETKKSKNTRNILVIPFSRFEFHTEIKLEKINEANELSGDQFYPLLVNMFSEAFVLNSSDRISYRIISDADLTKIRPYLKNEMKSGDGHYSCNLDNLNKTLLKEILDKHECGNLLTINWYRIMKDKTSYKSKGVKKISLYSTHFIDYDFFTSEGINIKKGSRLKINVPANSSNIKYMGLRFQDLKPEFKNLVDNVTLHLIGEN